MGAGETKAERFERIAERRVNEALRSLRLLGNLADRRNYEYTEEQVCLLLNAIDQEYKGLRSKFKSGSAAGSTPFRFKRGT
jgi:hypothetical protein